MIGEGDTPESPEFLHKPIPQKPQPTIQFKPSQQSRTKSLPTGSSRLANSRKLQLLYLKLQRLKELQTNHPEKFFSLADLDTIFNLRFKSTSQPAINNKIDNNSINQNIEESFDSLNIKK